MFFAAPQLAVSSGRLQHCPLNWGRTFVAGKSPRRPADSGDGDQTSRPTLRLVRTEAAGADGILMVYESDGQEHTWLLEHTSSIEVMALLMHGRLKKGRRIVVDAEVALEPPNKDEARPHLCFIAGPLESCVPVDRITLHSLRRDIDRFLAQPS